jgi:hypothetical protein
MAGRAAGRRPPGTLAIAVAGRQPISAAMIAF